MEEKKYIKIVKYQLLPMDFRLLFRFVALFVSWYYNESIFWGLLHFFLGWIYLVYVMVMGGFSEGGLGLIVDFYLNTN